MAGNSTATITFKLDGDVKTFQILAKDAESLKKVLGTSATEAESLKKVLGTSATEAKKLSQQLLDMNQAVEAFRGMETLIRGIESAFGSLSAEFNAASANETRLAQSMKTAMGATQEQVDAIISLTDAQEELGVVDGQFQISAAQQLAKFLQTTESLQTLIPLMNDMAAQQYGVAASEQNLMSIVTQRPVCKSVGEFCPPLRCRALECPELFAAAADGASEALALGGVEAVSQGQGYLRVRRTYCPNTGLKLWVKEFSV